MDERNGNDDRDRTKNWAEWLAEWSDPNSLKSREERRADEAQARRKLVLGQQLAAAVRSLSGHPDIDVRVGARDGDEEALSVAVEELSQENLPVLRGRLDSGALFYRLHDPGVHAATTPDDYQERRLFELLEVVRCEAVGARQFPGVEGNLVASHLDRLRRADLLAAHLASLIPVSEALHMVVRDTLLGRTDPSIAGSGFWMWDRWLRARLGGELQRLAESQDDQMLYAAAAKATIKALFRALETNSDATVRRPLAKRPDSGEAGDEDGIGSSSEHDAELGAFEPGSEIFPEGTPEKLAPLLHDRRDARIKPYAAFTTVHDKIVDAEALDIGENLLSARQELERKRAEYRRDLSRLVAQLQRRLMALQTRSWTFDLEEGLIDASRLDRVIVNPGFADAYKQEEESLFVDTAVTLLIDNSGSMRGKPIEIACIVADLIAAALERTGIACEILGFTTAKWKGGDSARDWERAGRPADPGRLNDLLHIVYKAADAPLRASRNNLAAMLSGGLLKENIDGEALAWAARRLSVRPERRRILIVISDGAPVDQATLEANSDPRILDRHLRQTIAEIERSDAIELAAIGIKHDVEAYYRKAVRIEKVEELGARLVALLDALLTR